MEKGNHERNTSKNDQEMIQCKTCEGFFFSKFALNKHVNSFHRNNEIKAGYKCLFCEKDFSELSWFVLHTIEFHSEEKNQASEERANESHDNIPELIKKEEEIIEEQMETDSLDFESGNETELEDETEDQEVIANVENSFTCDDPLADHFDIPETKNSNIESTLDQSKYGLLQCELCDKRFKSKKGYKYHIEVTHAKSNFKMEVVKQCGICEKGFQSIQGHKGHIRLFHTKSQRKTKDCEICGKTFFGKRDLKQHVKNVHEIYVPKSKCNQCGETFFRNEHLKRHIGYAHTYKTQTCDRINCLEQFEIRKELCNHIRKTHKDFLCSNCGITFPKRTLLEKHVNVEHSGIFKCITCEKVFKTLELWEYHITYSHN